MNHLKLAVPLEAAGVPPRPALQIVSKLGVPGVQVDAAGELAPDRLGDTARREFRTLLKSYSLELAAVNCPLRRGLDVAEDQQQRLDYVRKVMQLASDLGTRIVFAPLPRIPTDADGPRAKTLREVLTDLGRHGDRIGVRLCLEAGLDSGAAVGDYLGTYDTGGLAVTFDPANFQINGHDPLTAMTALAGRIGYVQARDARTATVSGGAKETAVGAGDTDWMVFFATLSAVDYRGFVAVDREDGTSRWKDITTGVGVVRRFAVPLG
ncbi:MAG: sugar phosphate isomerase/epimerase family protein [Fimbriiglobus sp.]